MTSSGWKRQEHSFLHVIKFIGTKWIDPVQTCALLPLQSTTGHYLKYILGKIIFEHFILGKKIIFEHLRFILCNISFFLSLSLPPFVLQELMEMRNQISQSGVQVDVDAPKGQDMAQVMEDMRANYEKMAMKNADELKHWHENQVGLSVEEW